APIYIGIIPLASTRDAEFLHTEVPGMNLTDEVRNGMSAVSHDRSESIEVGINISKELIDVALEHFHGVYLITPFMRYDVSVRLVEYIHEQLKATQGQDLQAKMQEVQVK